MSSPSGTNQTGFGAGAPLSVTVVSQTTMSWVIRLRASFGMSTSASASWRLGGLCVDLTVAGTTSEAAKLTRMVTWDEWRAGATHIEVGGLAIATYDLGPAGAPTYTFCHGYPSASLDIAEVAAQLDGLRLLALDMPGFGASDKPPADQGGGGHTYSIHAAADAVEALWRTTTACRWPRSCWPAGPAARSAEAPAPTSPASSG
jgi:hypothetical protein